MEKLSKKYGPMDHDVTLTVLAKCGPGNALCGQVVDGSNRFGGYVALHLVAGGSWVEVARASSRATLMAKIRKLKVRKSKEGKPADERDQSPTGDADPKPR